jgi:DNA polymerase, archaea type
MWAKLLEYPAPKFRRAAIDIEVYSPLSNRVPDAREGACPVIATSIYSSDGEKRVLILKSEGCIEGNEPVSDIGVERFDTEDALLREVFKVLNDYPFILTFNGDDFDLRYLVHRALNLGFSRNEIPIEVGKRVCLTKIRRPH